MQECRIPFIITLINSRRFLTDDSILEMDFKLLTPGNEKLP
jgi:hypothetical protein